MTLHASGLSFACLALASLLSAACSADHEPALESGQTGSIAPGQCLVDSDCDVFVEQAIAELQQPAESSRRFSGAACIEVAEVGQGSQRSGPACECEIAGEPGSSLRLGPAFLTECNVRNRIGGCLAPPAEFPGCDPAASSPQCLAACSVLEARLAEDARRTFEVGVRLSRCALDTARAQPAYECQKILELEGGCYTTTVPNRMVRYDCSLSDEEILGAASRP